MAHTENSELPSEPQVRCDDLLGLGLYVIEAKFRNKRKNLGPWKVVAAFTEREDAYSFFGKYHQSRTARVRRPNDKTLPTEGAAKTL